MVEGNPLSGHFRINTHYKGPSVPLRFRYQTFEFGGEDIHLRSLRDAQQYDDPDGEAQALGISAANWALFGVVWDSSQILARQMARRDIGGKRILELGCGMALSSLLLNRRGGNITATDYHPEAGVFLQVNTRLNEDREIPFFRADWEDPAFSHGRFDLIIGSDVLYERSMLRPLARFIQNHALNRCDVVLVDPGRKLQGPFTRQMLDYGFSHHSEKPEDSAGLFKGSVLTYHRG